VQEPPLETVTGTYTLIDILRLERGAVAQRLPATINTRDGPVEVSAGSLALKGDLTFSFVLHGRLTDGDSASLMENGTYRKIWRGSSHFNIDLRYDDGSFFLAGTLWDGKRFEVGDLFYRFTFTR
jgi:hypothetical protein